MHNGRSLTDSTRPDAVLIQCDLLMLSTVLLESCAGFKLLLLTAIGFVTRWQWLFYICTKYEIFYQ